MLKERQLTAVSLVLAIRTLINKVTLLVLVDTLQTSALKCVLRTQSGEGTTRKGHIVYRYVSSHVVSPDTCSENVVISSEMGCS